LRSLFTAPLFAEQDGSFSCSIVNVSGRDRIVSVFAFDADGDLIDVEERRVLAPGEAFDLGAGTSTIGPFYCEFRVEGTHRSFRASACVTAPGQGICTAVVPAT
jgi:hypothetical protein